MRQRILMLLICLGEVLYLFSKETDHFFNHYNSHFITEKEGLPNSCVNDIFKDSDGYIWVATYYGIGRYDGYQFLTYNMQTEPVKLKNDFVHKICEDNFKRLWITSEGGIDILDLNTYTLVQLPIPQESPLKQLMNKFIQTIYKDQQGNLWISCDRNLWCIELDEKGNIQTYYCMENPSSSPVQAIIDTGWAICAGIDNEVCRIEKQAGHSLKAMPLSATLPPFSEDWRILCMQVDGNLLWIGSNRGLFKYNYAEGSLKRYRYSTHRPGMLSQAYITDIKLTESGHLIVSTLNGVNVYNRDIDTFSFIRQTSEQDGGLLNCNAINCLFTEGETIWLGTETGGINLLALKRLRTELWTCEEAAVIGTERVVPVNVIEEDTEGNLWIGMVERGLMKWNPENSSCTHYRFSPNDITSLSNNTINGLLIDSDKYLWVYTWGVGINKLDLNVPDNRIFKRYMREEIPILEGDFINSACEDTVNHGIWFGSTRGVHFYDKQIGVFTKIQFAGNDSDPEAIHALLIDKKQRLWIGTVKGVFVVDLLSFAHSRKKFNYTYLKYKLDKPESPQLEKINCILEDRNGTIWLGGNGSGLYQLTESPQDHFAFKNYTIRDGLSNNTIIGMEDDKQGNLWLVTNDGLSRLDIQSMTFTNYTRADGLPVTQYYRNGICYSTKHNLIYLATTDGLISIHPDKSQLPVMDTAVKFSSLTVAGNQVNSSSGNYLEKNITQASRISLHEKESRFSVGLTTQNYGNSRRIRFAYQLKGYEKEWNETHPGEYMARYTYIPPGSYTLQVRATDELGHWSDKITEIKVDIAPYFYKSGWFYGACLVLICVGAWLFYRWKVRSYQLQKAELKQKVELRTQELADRNRQLEVMVRHVEDVTEEKIVFFTNITHEFRTPVTLIHGPIEHALKNIQDEAVKAQLEIAERNSRYLLSLVNELMDFRKLDMNKVTLNIQPHDFLDFLSELLLPFKVFAKERHIEIRTYFRLKHTCLMMDAAYMRKAMINLVSNAIKFTPDHGRIDIFVASIQKGKQLYINVYDTGHGIDEKDMDKIFDRFFQSKSRVKYPVYGQSGTGIGLFLCKKIVELHEGTIYARNNHSQGASFRILMPLVPGESSSMLEERNKSGDEGAASAEVTLEEGQKKEVILVVEDNKDMRSYIYSLLKKDYRIVEAENGEEALQMVQKHSVDLIVSDLMMPVMDGMELSRRIKENLATSHIPFLILTALRSEVQEKKSFEIGVDEYLCKPFDEEVLLLRIRNILNLRNQYKKRFSACSKVEQLPIKEESRDKVFITNAIGLMEKNYADSEYNLDCFVRDMGYSKTLVNKKMQDLTGQPIGQFMKGFRLNVAQRMIQEGTGTVNVSEIAYAVGFNDPKYFTRCFKEFFGYLPSSKLKK